MSMSTRFEVASLLTQDELHSSSETPLGCKFLILKTDDLVLLVFGSVSHYFYHADLLEGFCRQQGILGRWEKRPDQYEILDSAYAIRGGGHLALSQSARTARFGGISKAYGSFEPEDLHAILSGTHYFDDHTVELDQR